MANIDAYKDAGLFCGTTPIARVFCLTHLFMFAIAGFVNALPIPDQSLLLILIVSSGIIGILALVVLIRRRKQ